ADPVASWHEVTAMMQSALRDEVLATSVVSPRFGDMPFEDLVSRMVCSDTLVHTWDLSRATGQDEQLDPGAVAYAWTWMHVAGDTPRASGSSGRGGPPPADADTQPRLLCFLGRAV